MPTFEQALRSSLEGASTGFRAADADLHEQVVSASQALQRVAGGNATLTLIPVSESGQQVVYSLELGARDFKAHLGAYAISTNGYPIMALRERPGGGEWLMSDGIAIPNKKALTDHFVEMAANPDSPLVKHLAYVLRRQ